MDLLGLDAQLRPVKALRCVNIQWNRRYYEAGDFSLQMRAAVFDAAVAYVFTPDRPETGMVEKLETERTVKGDFVQVSGYFLEGMLNWKAVYPRYFATANVAEGCRALALAQLADLGVTVPDGVPLGGPATFDATGEPLGDYTYALLKLQELGQRIRLDYAAETLTYELWQGLDRTQSQSANPFAVFSQGVGTVDALTHTRDSSAHRNYAIAVYENGVMDVDVRADPGQPKRILYLDTGMAAAQGQAQADFLLAVETAARAELGKRACIVNLDATVLQAGARYLRDYDLGDRCDVRDDRLSLAYETRIIEANEVWKDNAHTVTLQFGEKIPVSRAR